MKSLSSLLEQLQNIQSIPDKRLAVLLLYLYSEHYALKLLEEKGIDNKFIYKCDKCDNVTGSRSLSLPEKIEKLTAIDVIQDNIKEPFILLNKARQRLIHDIEPDNKTIEAWIKEFKPPTTDDLKAMLDKENAWNKFYICIVSAIARLYQTINGTTGHLDRIEYNIPTKLWIFHVKK